MILCLTSHRLWDIMCHVIYEIMGNIGLGQDVVVILALFPNNPNPVAELNVVRNFDLNGDSLVWYARSQLFFNCTLCTVCSRCCQSQGYLADHKEVSLVYFSTFESLNLTPNRQVCLCYTTLPAARNWPANTFANTFALWQMYWGEPPHSLIY